MNFTQIMKFLDSGLSVEEVQKIIDKEKTPKGAENVPPDSSDVNANVQPVKPDEKAPTAESEPDWAKALTKSIENMTKTMQANALMGSVMAHPKSVNDSADEILANIINPKE